MSEKKNIPIRDKLCTTEWKDHFKWFHLKKKDGGYTAHSWKGTLTEKKYGQR